MRALQKTVEPPGDDVPPLAVGTFTFHGVVFLRADHVAQWLDEISTGPRYGGDAKVAPVVEKIRDVVALAGRP